MVRLRLLSALLGCLAVVAAGLPTYALAWSPVMASAAEQTAVRGLCTQHCPDCEGMPCPTTAAGCTVACVALAPALAAAAFNLAVPPGDVVVWLRPLAALHGLSPPPDPFPPRS
jgi:hypothetical protein